MAEIIDFNKKKKEKQVKIYMHGCFFYDHEKEICMMKLLSDKFAEDFCDFDDCPRKNHGKKK